jgi:competence protein ComEA
MNLPGGVKNNLLPVILVVLGIGLLLLGGFQLISHLSNSSSEVVFEEPSGAPVPQEKIEADIEGAVLKPGVYELSPDSRWVDALAKAGGLSEEADRDYVQKSINLAQKVSDGVKIYIPRVGEEVLTSGNTTNGTTVSSSVININTASAKDLDSLPGVGAVTAGKIIDSRPYATTEELVSKKVVGEAEFEKIRDQISAN